MTHPTEDLPRKVRQLDGDVLEIYDRLGAISVTLDQHTATLDQHTEQLTSVQESLAEVLRRLPDAS